MTGDTYQGNYRGNGGYRRDNDGNAINDHNRELRDTQKDNRPKNLVNVSGVDITVLLVTIILVLFGVVMVFSASYYTAAIRFNDMYSFLRKQALAAVMGFCAMLIAANFNYRYLKKFALLLYAFSCFALVFVAIFAEEVNGAKRWIELPVIGQFQPSEFAKIGLILFISVIISSNKNILKRWGGFFFCCGVVGAISGLVYLGSLSTTIVVFSVGMVIIFVSSPYTMRFVIMGLSAAGGLVSYIAFFSDSFRNERFLAWLNPFDYANGSGYQIIQGLYAVASGGAFGLGIGQSRQKSFTPEAQNDFIFGIICEEFGFLGALIVLMLFGVLIWRGLKIAINAPDTFGSLVATGIVTMLAVQVIINVAVVTNSMPNTGIPMPFISYGGTALVISMGAMGVLLNISRYEKEY